MPLDIKKIEAVYFYLDKQAMFAIGICDKQTGLQEGLCDIHFEHPISVEKLQAIVNICNEQIMEPIRNGHTMCVIDILREIADIIVLEKGSIEVDLNLQYAGTKTFANGVTDPTLLFVRGDMLWPANIFEWNNAEQAVHAVHALHTFLFEEKNTETSFSIGLIENSTGEEICEVTTKHLNLLICKELIHLLEEEMAFIGVDVHELIKKIQSIMYGKVVRHSLNPFIGCGNLMFMKENREWIYNGNVKEMLTFLQS